MEPEPAVEEGVPPAQPTSPKQVVTVSISGGKDFTKQDIFRQKADPFVTVTCGGQTKKTKKVKDSLSPTWDAQLTFVGVAADALVTAEVRDFDVLTADDPMGQVQVSLAELDDGAKAQWELQPMDGCPSPTGVLGMRVSKRDITDRDFDGEDYAGLARPVR